MLATVGTAPMIQVPVSGLTLTSHSLLVNKACHEVGSSALYGTNQVFFCREKRTDCGKWWTKKIGDQILQIFQSMLFTMTSRKYTPGVHTTEGVADTAMLYA